MDVNVFCVFQLFLISLYLTEIHTELFPDLIIMSGTWFETVLGWGKEFLGKIHMKQHCLQSCRGWIHGRSLCYSLYFLYVFFFPIKTCKWQYFRPSLHNHSTESSSQTGLLRLLLIHTFLRQKVRHCRPPPSLTNGQPVLSLTWWCNIWLPKSIPLPCVMLSHTSKTWHVLIHLLHHVSILPSLPSKTRSAITSRNFFT